MTCSWSLLMITLEIELLTASIINGPNGRSLKLVVMVMIQSLGIVSDVDWLYGIIYNSWLHYDRCWLMNQNYRCWLLFGSTRLYLAIAAQAIRVVPKLRTRSLLLVDEHRLINVIDQYWSVMYDLNLWHYGKHHDWLWLLSLLLRNISSYHCWWSSKSILAIWWLVLDLSVPWRLRNCWSTVLVIQLIWLIIVDQFMNIDICQIVIMVTIMFHELSATIVHWITITCWYCLVLWLE